MSQASEVAVSRVLSNWAGVEEDFLPADSLRALWSLQHPVSPAYEPHGIVRLIGEIRSDQLLGACESARSLEAGHFVSGGFVQTVQHLRDWVNPC
jgi:hypothetical protein